MKLLQFSNWILLTVGSMFAIDGVSRLLHHDFGQTPSINPILLWAVVDITLLLSLATFFRAFQDRKSSSQHGLWVPGCAVLACFEISNLVSSVDGYAWGSMFLCLFASGTACWIAFRAPKKWETPK